MSGFSGTVKLADLNDFIAPSQACVVNLESSSGKAVLSIPDDGGVALQTRPAGGWSQTLPTKSADDPVKISLQDCLACSGCVTSAETVLLEQQSIGELEARLGDPSCSVVVSVSGQSIASLAVAHGLSQAAAARKLAAFLRRLGVRTVLDITPGRDLALMEAAAEFLQRARDAKTSTGGGESGSGLDGQRLQSSAGCSTSGRGVAAMNGGPKRQKAVAREAPLPMLASACPGWVCYAEKTHGDYVLPYISSTKSPQAILGSLVKGPWAAERGLNPNTIYHCAIMPCYDKKLEAARDDFRVPGWEAPETDCVLTTVEVQQLLEQKGCRLRELAEEPFDSLLGGRQQALATWQGGSGGYMEYIYRVAAKQLYGITVPEGPLEMRQLRNADLQETILTVAGQPVLRFALAYGFRNIQTLLRKIKQGACRYDYVEIMACPSGCVNGGGQIKAQQPEQAQDLVRAVEAAYHHPEVTKRRPEDSLEAQQLYEKWAGDAALSPGATRLLHTQYHRLEKSVAAAIKDW